MFSLRVAGLNLINGVSSVACINLNIISNGIFIEYSGNKVILID